MPGTGKEINFVNKKAVRFHGTADHQQNEERKRYQGRDKERGLCFSGKCHMGGAVNILKNQIKYQKYTANDKTILSQKSLRSVYE